MPNPLSDSEAEMVLLKQMIFNFAKHTAYKQMISNEKIKNFYQLDDSATYSVEDDVNSVAGTIQQMLVKARLDELELAGKDFENRRQKHVGYRFSDYKRERKAELQQSSKGDENGKT